MWYSMPKRPNFPRSVSTGKGLPLRSQIHGAWGLLQLHCFAHRYCLVLTQVFGHLFTPGEVLPYWPLWDLKRHGDPCVSPLIMSFTHNEDDFLCHLATQHLKWTSWEKGNFLTSSHGASGAEHQWLLAVRGIPKQKELGGKKKCFA